MDTVSTILSVGVKIASLWLIASIAGCGVWALARRRWGGVR